MELVNEFRVAAPVDRAWRLLTDLERVAPCLPGAALTEVEGEEYRGTVRIKVGPVTVRYRGVARFDQLDEARHVAVLATEGREAQGQGKFRAVLRAEMTAEGGATLVRLTTDLDISGRVAQFGRGVIADVSDAILQQFAASLAALASEDGDLEAGGADDADDAAAAAAAPEPLPRVPAAAEAPALDLLALAGGRYSRRAGSVVAVVAVVVLVAILRRSLSN
jgi:uncharacterized protein